MRNIGDREREREKGENMSFISVVIAFLRASVSVKLINKTKQSRT